MASLCNRRTQLCIRTSSVLWEAHVSNMNRDEECSLAAPGLIGMVARPHGYVGACPAALTDLVLISNRAPAS